MFLVQATLLLNLPDKQMARYDDPKIQPFFAKMAALAILRVKMAGYQNFEQEVDVSGSGYAVIEPTRQADGQI